jgi:hypothetical protein
MPRSYWWPVQLTEFGVLLSTVVCLIVSRPGFATETAEVTRAVGSLQKYATTDDSPIPICWVWWRHTADEGTAYHETPADDFPYDLCDGELMVHCGTDTLAFTGWWPEGDVPEIGFFRRAVLQATLEVDLTVTEPTAITATRQWAGDVDLSQHEVTLIAPDGEVIVLLPADAPPDEAQQILSPGIYQIRIDLDVETYNHEFGAYSGSVTVVWRDASTPAASTTWGALKSAYR